MQSVVALGLTNDSWSDITFNTVVLLIVVRGNKACLGKYLD